MSDLPYYKSREIQTADGITRLDVAYDQALNACLNLHNDPEITKLQMDLLHEALDNMDIVLQGLKSRTHQATNPSK